MNQPNQFVQYFASLHFRRIVLAAYSAVVLSVWLGSVTLTGLAITEPGAIESPESLSDATQSAEPCSHGASPESALDSGDIARILERASSVKRSVTESVEKQSSASVEDLFSNFPYDHNVLGNELQSLIRAPGTDLKEVARGLIARKKKFLLRWSREQSSENERASQFPKSLDGIELLCFIPEQYIDSVLSAGQKNIHQVGHSRGLCEKEVRAKAEDFMIGIHLEEKYDAVPSSPMHQLRPKYGFVNFFSPCDVRMNPFRLFQYGQLIVVYADAVKERTTYTFGDSLASYCEPLSVTMNPLDPVPLSLLRPPSSAEKTCRYVEAQIWGPITSADIKEIRIPKERADLSQKLVGCGLPVFSYDRQKIEETDLYTDVSDCGWQRGEPLNKLAVELALKERLAHK